MRKSRIKSSEPLPMLAPLPGWITATPPETLAVAAFKSGAALAHLNLAMAADHVPQALWRDRLALAAAEVSAGIAGRREGVSAMRDGCRFAGMICGWLVTGRLPMACDKR